MATHSRQMSDAFRTTVFLTLSGGFQDAYTYMGRGKVFCQRSNRQYRADGHQFCEGDFAKALRYLFAAAGPCRRCLFCRGHPRNRYHLMERFPLAPADFAD